MYLGGKMNRNGRNKLPVVLEPEEVHSLLMIPNTRYLTSLRNKAMISIMVNCGLRVSEVVQLKSKDLNLDKAKLRVVDGKGKKDRDILSINPGTINLLKEWDKRKPESEYFFCTIKNRKGIITFKDGSTRNIASKSGNKTSVRFIQSMVERYTERAGINKVVSPHTLRHTFATEYYRETKDIETLKTILGHTSISTTQIYITLASIDVENGMKQFKGFG